MNTLNDIDPQMAESAVSVYENDATEGFPVLKAFQQYIDAEQAKARKRMLMICVFFGFLMTIMISVFVLLLVNANARNQTLNDRLVEYAMKDRASGPVVVQPQDNTAILTIVNKLEEMKKAFAEEKDRASNLTPSRTAKTVDSAKQTTEALEIVRLKTLLAVEKEKASAEREKQRQLELEAYRREHYPEIYGIKRMGSAKRSMQDLQRESDEADREIESILDDDSAINYFENDDEEDETDEKTRTRNRSSKSTKRPAPMKSESADRKDEAITDEAVPSSNNFKIPVDVKDASGSSWSIPRE